MERTKEGAHTSEGCAKNLCSDLIQLEILENGPDVLDSWVFIEIVIYLLRFSLVYRE